MSVWSRSYIDAGLHDTFHNHMMRLQPELVEMTCNGVTIDTRTQRQSSQMTSDDNSNKRANYAKTRLVSRLEYQITSFNPRSPQQLADLLFGKLQLVGRGSSVDKENRDRIKRHPRTAPVARELVEAIDSFLQQARFVSNYVGARPDTDGRWRCDYKQTGVASAPGRLSSSQTSWDTGLNYQNIPEQAKPMFIAPPGWEFSYYDMSQIEARFVACLAHIPVWLSQFEQARLQPGTYDAHCALAAEMFKVSYGDVPRQDREPDGKPTIRYVAKRCRHGLNYRMAPDRLATVTGLSAVEAEQAYRLYHMATPEITVWWDDLVALVRRDRSITTALGRRWMLLEHWSDDALDSIVAFEPQSLNGDWTSSGDLQVPHRSRVAADCSHTHQRA